MISTLKPEPSSPGPTEDATLKWVAKVDDYIDAESLAILKLSAQSELTQNERDGVKCASDLYRALAKHYTDLKVLLARFIYALEKLGHRRYGYRAIRVLPITDRPAPFDHSKLQPKVAESEFIFFQRLAALCCMLPRSYHTNFIAYFIILIILFIDLVQGTFQLYIEARELDPFLFPDAHLDDISSTEH